MKISADSSKYSNRHKYQTIKMLIRLTANNHHNLINRIHNNNSKSTTNPPLTKNRSKD